MRTVEVKFRLPEKLVGEARNLSLVNDETIERLLQQEILRRLHEMAAKPNAQWELRKINGEMLVVEVENPREDNIGILRERKPNT